MTSNTFKLPELLRTTVGYDQLIRNLDALSSGQTTNYPPYDIIMNGDDTYEIRLAVAGCTEDEITVQQSRNELTVDYSPTRAEGEYEPKVIHRGIANRAFTRTFTLAEHIKVVGADMNHGILCVTLQREIPESEKPRTFTINKPKTRRLL